MTLPSTWQEEKLLDHSIKGCCMAASLVFRLHDRGPELVREVLLERGWTEYREAEREEEDWNLYWRGGAFRNAEYHNLLPWQRLNHHPKTAGITRKDCLARNLRRMRSTFGSSLYDFSPSAFILPNDFTRFLAEYNRLLVTRATKPSTVYWICKPVDLSRGRGIFIFEDIKDLVYDCSVIVQRYISNPLLISGYKFDLRIYVCVKSFHPLSIYIHQEGLVRFATEKYNLESLQNLYAHLTNTSINKFGPFYKTEKEKVGQGCKWTMSKFRHFLQGQNINEVLLWQRMNNIVTLTLLTIAASVPSCPNCVELFGFDILIDVKFKPWLLEVNYSPALTLDCQADIAVKKGLISDLIDLMNYTQTDSLREKAFQRDRYEHSCVKLNPPSHVSIPVLTKLKETKFHKRRTRQSSKIQTLPMLKTHRQSEKINQTHSKKNDLVADHTHLPPVALNKISGVRKEKLRKVNAIATKTNTDKKGLNPILGPHSKTNVCVVKGRTCPGLEPWRRADVSGVTPHRDDTEREAEMELFRERHVSFSSPDPTHRSLGFGRSPAVSWKLPNIYSGNQRPVKIPLEEASAKSRQHIPPMRVGDFIRTFPFNTVTLKASQHELDVRRVVQEIHKLTGRLASDRTSRTEEEEVTKDMEAFNSLLWGPKDPPLLSQCFKST